MRARRLATLLMTGALVLGAAPAADADKPRGTVRVTMMDAPGTPVAGGLILVPVGGTVESAYFAYGDSTHDFKVPPGRYAVAGLSAWGGFRCAGATACRLWGLLTEHDEQPGAVEGVVSVADGELATYVLGAPPPARIMNAGRVDPSTLTVAYSAAMIWLAGYVTGRAEFGWPQVQWLRDGAVIQGATGPDYTPGVDDVDHSLSVRLTYHPWGATFLEREFGADPTPITIAPAGVRQPSTTTTSLRRAEIPRGHRGRLRVRVAGGAGEARIVVDRSVLTCVLTDGSCRVRLPQLRPGRYAVAATFQGSDALLPSTADLQTLTVRR